MHISSLKIIALFMPIKSVFAFGDLTCQCLRLSNSYFAFRLWEIVNPNWTDRSVFTQFQQGFTPNVTAYKGFKEYLSAFTGNSSRPFFFNVFETADQAALSQAAAREFVSKGVLNGVISPFWFLQGVVKYWISSTSCLYQPKTGVYLSTRLWRFLPSSPFTPQSAIDYGVANFVLPNITKSSGFIEYGIAVLSDNKSSDILMLYFNFFETQEFALSSNAAAAKFVATSALNSTFEKIVFTQGLVRFDYTCSAKEDPRTIPPVTAKTSAPTRPTTTLHSGAPTVTLCIALQILALHSTLLLFV